MQTKTLSDGSAWARINWLDVTNTKSWFQDANEVQFCINQTNRYSRMGLVDQFKSLDGYYEFMLTYPSLSSSLYNRWKQTSSPNSVTVTGFTKISMSWDTKYAGGLRICDTFYKCDPNETWFAPIGQQYGWVPNKNLWIPSVTEESVTSTELWVRIDNVWYNSCKVYSDRIECSEIIEY